MGLDLVQFDAALKQHYISQRVENLTYEDNPLHALMAKYARFGGRNLPLVIQHGNAQGRSNNFARAQANANRTNGRYKDFNLTRIKNYGIVTIDNETMEASEGDANAFLSARTAEIDGVIRELTNSVALQEYGSGYGERGQVGSISTTTITLKNIKDVVKFEIGMEIVGSAALTTGAIRAVGSSGNGLYITSVDRSLGKLGFGYNVTDATNGVPLLVADDYLYVRGDRTESGTVELLAMCGLEAWLPSTAPTAGDNFFGVDRSVDPTRLAGLRKDISSYPIEEGFIEAAAEVNLNGGNIDHIFTTFATWVALEKAMGAKVQYVDLRANAQIGFRGIEIMGQKGPIKIVPDRNCPTGKAYGLTMSTWKLYSLGEAVRVIDTDGNTMLRQSDADGVEIRWGGYMQCGTSAPGKNINLTVST